jgi:hypothetical protein
MSLLTDVLNIADKVTASLKLQSSITLARYTGSDAYGTETYSGPVSLKVAVEYKQRSVKTSTGEIAISTATVTFLNLVALVAATPAVAGVSVEGEVFTQDKIVLPNGGVPPILNIGGFVDGGTGRLIPTEVYLG